MPRPKPKPLGERIRRLRESKGLDLNELANETGHSVELLAKIEANQVLPPVAMLLQLARALEVDTGTFLKEEVETPRWSEDDAKRAKSYVYKSLTPKASHKHLKAFLITVPARSVHEPLIYRHEGEEFAFVLKGEVEYTVGENVNRLGPSESIHFISSIPHQLENVGDQEAELVVVLYTP